MTTRSSHTPTAATRFALFAALTLAAIAGSARAQNSAQPLRGPAVDSKRVPGVEDSFSGMEKGGPKNGDRGYPHKAFMDALAKLRGENAPDAVRLTAEQESQIQSLDDEFRKEARTLAEKGKGRGTPPGPDGPGAKKPQQTEGAKPAGEVRPLEAQRPRAEALKVLAPKANEVHSKMWATLTDPQQKFLEGELAEWRKGMEARRGEEYMERRLKDKGAEAGKPGEPGAAAPKKPGAGGGPADRPGRERARRIVERLSQLPPEERDRILARLEEELDKRDVGRKGKDGDRKPAPGMDGVNVPKPADAPKPPPAKQ